MHVQDQMCAAFDVHPRKIGVFKRDPLLKKAFGKRGRVTFCNALLLRCGIDIQKDGKVVVLPEGGVHGVCALNDGQLLVRHGDRVAKRLRGAIKLAVAHGLVHAHRAQHVVHQSLAVQIAAYLSKPLGRALRGLQEKVVCVEEVAGAAAVNLQQSVCQRGFTACAAALKGDDRAAVCQAFVYLGQQGQNGDVLIGDHAVGGAICQPKSG